MGVPKNLVNVVLMYPDAKIPFFSSMKVFHIVDIFTEIIAEIILMQLNIHITMHPNMGAL